MITSICCKIQYKKYFDKMYPRISHLPDNFLIWPKEIASAILNEYKT